MIYWLLQFADLVYYHILHLFFIYGAFCWFIFLLRLTLSAPYKPFQSRFPRRVPVSILVPIYNEKIDVLLESLGSIISHTGAGDEVLALIDVRDKAALDPGALIRHPRLKMIVAPPGKRQALVMGFQQARNAISIVTGSDTQFNKDTVGEIVKPFLDPKVGGVTGRVITAHNRGVGGKCYEWSLVLRNKMIYPAMSRSGTVHVLNGECYAVRTELAVAYQQEFVNQVFLGKKCDSGDDGWMTTLLLKYDYRTVYQASAVAYTNPPDSFTDFLRQQLRWNRNSTRRSLMVLTQGWAYKRGPLYPFQLFVALFKLPFWLVVITFAAYRYFFGHDIGVVATTWFDPEWHIFRPLIFIVGIIIIRAVRGLPYLLDEPKAWLFLPVYAFLSPFILAPYKLYGMLTARDTRWLTRGGQKEKDKSNVVRTSTIALIFLIVITFPLLTVAVALADDDSDSY